MEVSGSLIPVEERDRYLYQSCDGRTQTEPKRPCLDTSIPASLLRTSVAALDHVSSRNNWDDPLSCNTASLGSACGASEAYPPTFSPSTPQHSPPSLLNTFNFL